MVILAVLGLLLSIYLTIYHYFASVPLVCPTTGIINCANVLNSQYAIILGIPVAVYGIAFFLVNLFLLLVYKNNELVLGWNVVGLGFVFYFLYSEYMVGSICEYCTAVHIIVILLLASSAYKFLKS